ncbi:MAG: hypothetical protein R3Y64_11550 [Peptostreptococcaceae bacterium]
MKLHNEIKELLKVYMQDIEYKQSIDNNIYFAISEPDGYLITIGRTKEAFTKHKSYLKYAKIYRTTSLKYLLYYEKTTNKINSISLLTKLTVVITAQLLNLNIENHLNNLGVSELEFNNLLEYKIKEIKGKYKSYNRKQLLHTFTIEEKIIEDTFLLKNLLEEITYEDIQDDIYL